MKNRTKERDNEKVHSFKRTWGQAECKNCYIPSQRKALMVLQDAKQQEENHPYNTSSGKPLSEIAHTIASQDLLREREKGKK